MFSGSPIGAGGAFLDERERKAVMSGGYMENAAPTPPPTGISAGIQRLAETAEALTREVSLLEQKLSLVLRPTGPEAEGKGGNPIDASPLAGGLSEIQRRIDSVGRRVASMTARLDY